MSESKIGLLLPRSSLYTTISADIINGMKARFELLKFSEYRLIVENIGFGADEGEIYSKAEKMIYQEDVRIVVAFLDHMAAIKLDALFESAGRILLVIDPGGHIPLDWKKSDFRYTISMQTSLAARITGEIAAKEGAVKNIFATSFYEAGYLNCFSMQRGLTMAGGNCFYHFVIPFRLEETNISLLSDAVDHIKPDAVLAQYSAEAGGVFLNKFKSEGLHKKTKVYVSAFMLEEKWLDQIDFPFEGITGVVSWTRAISTQLNDTFKELLKNSAGLFSLTGWEAADFIYKLSIINFTGINSVNLSFYSPRGYLQLDCGTNHYFSPMYLVALVSDRVESGCRLEIKEIVSVTNTQIETFVQDIPTGVMSKWTNTYLCI